MTKYVPDTASGRWVIFTPSRAHRPDEMNHKHAKVCTFCEGNELLSPNEVYRIGKGEKNKPGWDVRVINNIFPITEHHEVIIHSPDDTKNLHDLPLEAVQKVLQCYKDRFNFHKKSGHVIIFCNHGVDSGASIAHSHSQLVVIPHRITLDTLNKEPLNNLVTDNNYFRVYCPEYSQWPYEVWISPKEEGKMYGDITEHEITDLAEVLQKVLKRLVGIHENTFSGNPFSYNFYIHPKKDWYLRVIPRFVTRAGFELGTGLSVNIVEPGEAAIHLREGEAPMMNVMSKLEKLGS